VWITGNGSGRLGVFDPNTGNTTWFAPPRDVPQPVAIAVDSEDRVWFAGSSVNRVVRFDWEAWHYRIYKSGSPESRIGNLTVDRSFHRVWFTNPAQNRIGRIGESGP
jgi:streptogramin lyase